VNLLDRRLGIVAGLVLESGTPWGEVARDFQVETARAVLDPDAAPYTFTVRARGASKTGDLSACALALLLTCPPRSRLYWAAADAAQAVLGLDAIGGYVQRTEALHGSMDVQSRRVLLSATGSSIDFLPADEAGSWGLRPYAVFVDELAAWGDTRGPRRLLDALTTAVTKVPGAKLAVLTSAGGPRHFAFRLLEHARSDPLWATFERTGPAPWQDRARLAEQRRRLPEAVYAQLFEGAWVEAEGDFLPESAVDACFTLSGPALRAEPGVGYLAALDLGHVHDSSVLAVGHRTGAGDVVLDGLRRWQGSRSQPVSFEEVEQAVVAAHGRFRFRLLADPWQGLHLFERLRARGVPVREFSFSTGSKQRLASTLLQAVNDGALRLFEADGLREELLGLRLKQGSGGSWAFDSAAGGRDDMAVALALLTVGLLERQWGEVGHAWFREPPPHASEPVTVRGDLMFVGERYVDRPSSWEAA